MARRWKAAAIAVEGVTTGDGRVMSEGALTWSDLPLPLGWLQQSQHGDGMGNPGAVDVGNIDRIDRQGNMIPAGGVLDDTEGAPGAEVARKLADGTAPLGSRWGISVDLDDITVEIIDNRTAEQRADDEAQQGEDGLVILASFSGAQARRLWRSEQSPVAIWRALTAAAGDPVAEDAEVLDSMDPSSMLMRLTSGRVRGATLCAIAAFSDAWVELDNGEADPAVEDPAAADEALTSSASLSFPARPPRAWFHEDEPATDDDPLLRPQYDVKTGAFIGLAVPLTIITSGPKAGQVFGHLAPKERCHIGIDGVCTLAPQSAATYSHFHLGAVECADGSEVATGALVAHCDHAPHELTQGRTLDHYANTSLAWADVRMVDGKYGPWFSGALRPDIDPALLRAVKASGVSGDWRGVNGRLELMAVQSVNTPGFTVQRLAASATRGEVTIPVWTPRLTVDGEAVTVSTPPVVGDQPAPEPVTAAGGCSCGGGVLEVQTGVGLEDLAALLRGFIAEQRSFNRRVDARTIHLRADARNAAAARLGRK